MLSDAPRAVFRYFLLDAQIFSSGLSHFHWPLEMGFRPICSSVIPSALQNMSPLQVQRGMVYVNIFDPPRARFAGVPLLLLQGCIISQCKSVCKSVIIALPSNRKSGNQYPI